jgi:ankyrin repeat protein
MRKRLRDLEEKVGCASGAVEQPATSALVVSSKRQNSLMDGDDDLFAHLHDNSDTKSQTSHGSLHLRAISNQTEAPFGKDDQINQSSPNSFDPLDTLYSPSEVVSPAETIAFIDPFTLWNLPNPNKSAECPVLSTEWPDTPSIHDSTDQSQSNRRCNLPKQLNEDTVSKALKLSDSDKDLIGNLQDNTLDMTASSLSGQTALHIGAKNGYQRIVVMLLERGGNVDDTDALGQSALHMAAAGGHQAVVQLLIDRSARADLKDALGRTSLHLAAENGHAQAVRSLMQQMPMKEVKDVWGRTPLHVAIECGHEDIVRLLLENGADPRARVSP